MVTNGRSLRDLLSVALGACFVLAPCGAAFESAASGAIKAENRGGRTNTTKSGGWVPARFPSTGKSEDKKLTTEVVERLATAWNKSDTETIAALFSSDAVLIMPTGSVIRSRPQIKRRIADERGGRLKETTLRNTVENVSLVDAHTAVVKGRYQLEGMRILGFETSPEGSFVLRQKKQRGRWLIARAEIQGR